MINKLIGQLTDNRLTNPSTFEYQELFKAISKQLDLLTLIVTNLEGRILQLEDMIDDLPEL